MVTSVTNVQVSKNGHDYVYQEYCGLSTDSKPTTKVFNGSTFLEMDTGDLYVFDAESMTWRNPWAES